MQSIPMIGLFRNGRLERVVARRQAAPAARSRARHARHPVSVHGARRGSGRVGPRWCDRSPRRECVAVAERADQARRRARPPPRAAARPRSARRRAELLVSAERPQSTASETNAWLRCVPPATMPAASRSRTPSITGTASASTIGADAGCRAHLAQVAEQPEAGDVGRRVHADRESRRRAPSR